MCLFYFYCTLPGRSGQSILYRDRHESRLGRALAGATGKSSRLHKHVAENAFKLPIDA